MTLRNRLYGALFCVSAGALQGCATPRPTPVEPAPTPALEGAPELSPAPEPATKPDPAGALTLQEALAATLAGSPELRAYSWALRAADAETVQAAVLPNPEFAVNPENFVGSGVFARQVQFQNTLQLSQLVELGGKREKRTAAATEARDRTALEYEAKRVEVLGATTIDFIGVVRDQAAVKLAHLATAQADESLRAARKRIGAGLGSPLEEMRARVLLARTQIAARHVEHQLLTSKQKLAAHWGAGTPLFAEARGDLFGSTAVPPLEALLARLESSPERRVAVAEGRVRAAEAALARTKQTPDVTLAAAWRHGKTWDDQTAVVGFSVPLQVFNSYQGEIAAADALVGRAGADTASVESRLRSVLFGLYQEILHAQGEMEAMRAEIVPRSEEALALARTGFAQGLYTQLELLDAQRTLVEVRADQIRAAATYHELVAEVERVLGDEL